MTDNNLQRLMGLAMLQLNEAVAPMHDWLLGERTYFVGQGYSPDEARAMAASTYVTVFGQKITTADPGGQEGKA